MNGVILQHSRWRTCHLLLYSCYQRILVIKWWRSDIRTDSESSEAKVDFHIAVSSVFSTICTESLRRWLIGKLWSRINDNIPFTFSNCRSQASGQTPYVVTIRNTKILLIWKMLSYAFIRIFLKSKRNWKLSRHFHSEQLHTVHLARLMPEWTGSQVKRASGYENGSQHLRECSLRWCRILVF